MIPIGIGLMVARALPLFLSQGSYRQKQQGEEEAGYQLFKYFRGHKYLSMLYVNK
jgi:hypothetical protein